MRTQDRDVWGYSAGGKMEQPQREARRGRSGRRAGEGLFD